MLLYWCCVSVCLPASLSYLSIIFFTGLEMGLAQYHIACAEVDLGSGLLNYSPVSFYIPYCVPSILMALSLGSESEQEQKSR